MSIQRKPIIPIRVQLVLSEILSLLFWPIRAAVAYFNSLMLLVFVCVVTLARFAPDTLIELGNDLRAATPYQIEAFTHHILSLWLGFFIIGIGAVTFVAGRLPWSRRNSSMSQPAIIGSAAQKPQTGDK